MQDKSKSSGRKSKYETHVLPRIQEIEAWCRDGLSEENIALKLGVAYSTFRLYKSNNSALSAVLARVRDYVDDVEVVPAYLKRVKGYDVTERKREYLYVKDESTGKYEKVLFKETEQERHIPPDPRAAEFWLTNRQPDKWKRQPEAAGAENEFRGGVIEIPAVMEEGGNDE
ncbi:MAG: hypothetical protein IJ299_04560 [Oscillospiraceae bacterium]|nr:hypothetical protein [Oscillospiraceae bacterium]